MLEGQKSQKTTNKGKEQKPQKRNNYKIRKGKILQSLHLIKLFVRVHFSQVNTVGLLLSSTFVGFMMHCLKILSFHAFEIPQIIPQQTINKISRFFVQSPHLAAKSNSSTTFVQLTSPIQHHLKTQSTTHWWYVLILSVFSCIRSCEDTGIDLLGFLLRPNHLAKIVYVHQSQLFSLEYDWTEAPL